jgi:Lon protease-like protein
MTREALEGDRKIAIVLLKEGWEAEYDRTPPVHEIACLGQIETYQELEDGKYDIVLEGLSRIRLIREIAHSPYRRAEVEAIMESSCDDQSTSVIGLRNHLGGLFARYAELAAGTEPDHAEPSLQMDFETLVNVAATTLNLPAADRQALLEMDDLTGRCHALIPVLQHQLESLLLVRRFEHLKPEEPRWN